MYVWTLLNQIIHSLQTHKLRSFLAMFGIMWGTLAVITLLALGNGFYSANQKNMASLSSGLITIMPGFTSIPYKGEPTGRLINIKINDVIALKKVVNGIKWISPIFGTGNQDKPISYHNKDSVKPIVGVSSEYQQIQSIKMTPGSRFINQIDIQQHQRVAFIGYQTKQELFGKEKAIGDTIHVDGIPFIVIGVLSDKTASNFMSFWDKIRVFIPYSTYLDINGNQNVDNIFVLPKRANQSQHLANTIKLYFANKFIFSPKDKQAIIIPDFNKATEFFNWFFFAIQAFLTFAGFMTLSVGGVGVANIMYLIVSERTPEICLRMALGARDIHVITQILVESFLIIFTGGIAGIFIASSIIKLISILPLPSWLGKPFVSTESVVITIIILTVVTLLSGWFPANTAAKTPPAQALH